VPSGPRAGRFAVPAALEFPEDCGVLAVLLLVGAPYAAAAVGYLEARRRGEAPPRWARLLGAATAAIHLAALIALGARAHRSPFQTGSEALSFLAFSLAGLYLVLEATSRVATHGGGFYLLTAILACSAVPGLASAGPVPASPHAGDPMRAYHVGFALLGTANVLAGGLLAVGYLGAYRRAKAHVVDTESGGPSLFGLQVLARHASALALLLLAPSLALGTVSVVGRDVVAWPAAAEIAVAAAQFGIVLAAAFLWWRRPRQGALAAWLNVAAVAVALLGFAVVHPLLLRSTAA
jgi:hypothetical protein